MDNPIPIFTTPATSPLIQAICTGSLADTLRVRLLSIPQQRHAPATSNEPIGNLMPWPSPHERTMPPAIINAMPRKMRRSKFSLNTNHASNAVNTPSRFSSKALLDAGVRFRPSIRKTGPAMPPAIAAPASHGMSFPLSPASFVSIEASLRQSIHIDNPMPEPRYSNPASMTGVISPSNSLAKGVLAPNKTAADIAKVIPLFISSYSAHKCQGMRKALPIQSLPT